MDRVSAAQGVLRRAVMDVQQALTTLMNVQQDAVVDSVLLACVSVVLLPLWWPLRRLSARSRPARLMANAGWYTVACVAMVRARRKAQDVGVHSGSGGLVAVTGQVARNVAGRCYQTLVTRRPAPVASP